MPKLTTTVETTVTVTTAVKNKVLAEMRVYAEQQGIRNQAEALMDSAKQRVEKLLTDAGARTLLENGLSRDEFEGFGAKRISGKGKRLDKKILTRLGVIKEMFDEATVEFDKKPYVRIWMPGEREYDDRSED